jgi:aminopeptidase N
VHELAHQWFGDSLTIGRWRDIWLNEGFATYAEWLWSEAEGLGTAQETYDFFYDFVPADHELWQLTIGDPGPEQLFDFPVYFRGAMTLHQLRLTVGDRDFFRIVRAWAQSRAGELVSTPEFVRLAERVSGQQLDDLFETWLYTAGRPELPGSPAGASPRATEHEPPAAAATKRLHRTGRY